MSLSHSPQIVTNNLEVFFDAGNSKSYTYGVNRLRSSSNLSSIWTVNATATRTSNFDVAPDSTTTSTKIDTASNVAGLYQYIDISQGDTYTYSIYLKYINGNPVIKFGSDAGTNNSSINANCATGQTSTNSGTPFGISSVNVGNGWYRFYFSLTSATTGTIPMVIFSTDATPSSFLVWGPQIEKSSSVSAYVPTTSFSTNWNDLIGGRVATLTNNAAFSYDKITFNGTSSIAPFNISGINFSTGQTIIMGIMPNESDVNRRNPYNHEYGGYGTITHEPAGDFNYFHGISGGNGQLYQGTNSIFTVAQNEKTIISISRGASNVKWYKNGVLQNTVQNNYPVAVNSIPTAEIGYGYAGAYSGDIYFLMMYNRQLSDSEVTQNFNALRSRYGL